jgi:hypothetical protein
MMSHTLRFFANQVGDTISEICGVKEQSGSGAATRFQTSVPTTLSIKEIVTDETDERTYWTCETDVVRGALKD